MPEGLTFQKEHDEGGKPPPSVTCGDISPSRGRLKVLLLYHISLQPPANSGKLNLLKSAGSELNWCVPRFLPLEENFHGTRENWSAQESRAP